MEKDDGNACHLGNLTKCGSLSRLKVRTGVLY